MDPRESWEEEMSSAHLYRVIAAKEADPPARELFEGLAEAAEKQARLWARRLAERGESPPEPFAPSTRLRLVAALVRALGPRAMRPALSAMKVRGMSVYSRPSAPEEHAMPTSLGDFGARHRSVGGGNLRAAVFGVNDGLVSNTSLILGVAGATSEGSVVLLSGVAGLLAGAFSMAAGEYVSVRSQRELFEYQIALEAAELDEYPEEETEELALIYRARGLSLERAREVARALMRDRKKALDALAREELGLDPENLGSPFGAALSSFLAFGGGALVPVLPFAVLPGRSPVAVAASVAGAALFAVGCALSLFTGRSALWSGARMVLIGGAAGAATWLAGSLLGVDLA